MICNVSRSSILLDNTTFILLWHSQSTIVSCKLMALVCCILLSKVAFRLRIRIVRAVFFFNKSYGILKWLSLCLLAFSAPFSFAFLQVEFEAVVEIGLTMALRALWCRPCFHPWCHLFSSHLGFSSWSSSAQRYKEFLSIDFPRCFVFSRFTLVLWTPPSGSWLLDCPTPRKS